MNHLLQLPSLPDAPTPHPPSHLKPAPRSSAPQWKPAELKHRLLGRHRRHSFPLSKNEKHPLASSEETSPYLLNTINGGQEGGSSQLQTHHVIQEAEPKATTAPPPPIHSTTTRCFQALMKENRGAGDETISASAPSNTTRWKNPFAAADKRKKIQNIPVPHG